MASITSNPAALRIWATACASCDGLVSAVTDWYAELPMTSAIRFSANAAPEPADAAHASIATMERKRRTITDLPLADINVGRARQQPACATRTPR